MALRIKASRHGLKHDGRRQIIGQAGKSRWRGADARDIGDRRGRDKPISDETGDQPWKMPHALGPEPVGRGER